MTSFHTVIYFPGPSHSLIFRFLGIEDRDRFVGIFIFVSVFGSQKVSSHAVKSKRCLLAMTDEDSILAGHAVELDVYFVSIVVLGIQGD